MAIYQTASSNLQQQPTTYCIMKAFVALALLVAAVSAKPRFSCPADEIVLNIPDDTNCAIFYKCDHGEEVKFNCQEGLIYNPDYEVCDWPYNVKHPGCVPGGPDPSTSGPSSPSATPSSSSAAPTSPTATPSSSSAAPTSPSATPSSTAPPAGTSPTSAPSSPSTPPSGGAGTTAIKK